MTLEFICLEQGGRREWIYSFTYIWEGKGWMLGPPSVVVGGNKPVALPLSSIYSPPFAFTSVTTLKSKKEYTPTPLYSAFTPHSCTWHPKKEEFNCVSSESLSISLLILRKVGSREIQLPPFLSVGRYCCFCRTLWRHPDVWYAPPLTLTLGHTLGTMSFQQSSTL